MSPFAEAQSNGLRFFFPQLPLFSLTHGSKLMPAVTFSFSLPLTNTPKTCLFPSWGTTIYFFEKVRATSSTLAALIALKPLKEIFLDLNNEQLVTLCKEGNRSAQKVLYERFATRMQRVCLRYLKNQMDAEEVLINGFMKVYKSLDKMEYRNDRSFEAWIKRIMVNESLMFLRRQHNFHMVSEAEGFDLAGGSGAADNLEAEDIYQMVRELPTGYRTVFNLYAIEGYSHKEIADQLSISENTSKSQLSKARAALKRMLETRNIS